MEWIRIAAVCVAAIAAGLAIWGYKAAKQAEKGARETAEAFRQLREALGELAWHLKAYCQRLEEEASACDEADDGDDDGSNRSDGGDDGDNF